MNRIGPRQLYYALLVIVAAIARASAAQELTFDVSEITLNPQIDATEAVAMFTFRNTSDSSVKVKSIEATCGCISTHWDQRSYSAGDRGSIAVVFTVGEMSGRQSKKIVVSTNDRVEDQITLTLNIDMPAGPLLSAKKVSWIVGGPRDSQIITVLLPIEPGYTLDRVRVVSSAFTARLSGTPDPRVYQIAVEPVTTQAAVRDVIEVITNHRTYRIDASIVQASK